jgi:hypothetical protein
MQYAQFLTQPEAKVSSFIENVFKGKGKRTETHWLPTVRQCFIYAFLGNAFHTTRWE